MEGTRLVDVIREELENNRNSAGDRELPDRAEVSPLVYKILRKEMLKSSWIDGADIWEDAPIHIVGVRVEKSDDLTALLIKE